MISYVSSAFSVKHRWFSGRMLACHAGGPGSIPGRCKSFYFFYLNFSDYVLDVPTYGKLSVDIGYGGAFYILIAAKDIGLNVSTSKTSELQEAAGKITGW